MSVKQYVHCVAQCTGANVFIAKIGIRNFALIERVADPADRIGIGPGNPESDSGSAGLVSWNIWCGCNASEVQAEVGGRCADRIRQSILSGQNPRARREVGTCCAELVLGDFDLEFRQPIARREQGPPARCLSAGTLDRRRYSSGGMRFFH